MKWLLKKTHVSAIIDNRFGEMVSDRDRQIIVCDKEYRTVSLKWVANSITSDEILTGAYKESIFDCEDMAFYLRTKASLFSLHNNLDAPMAIGILMTHYHAFNFCIDNSKALTIIDTTNYSEKGYCRNKNNYASFLELDETSNLIRLIFI